MAINGGDLFKRTCAGAIYIVITGALTFFSWYTCALVMAVTAAMCCREFLGMASQKGHNVFKPVAVTIAALMPLATAIPVPGAPKLALALAVAAVGVILCLFRFGSKVELSIEDLSLSIFSFIYTALPLTVFVLIRASVSGFGGGLMCVLILLSVWMNDAFAYLGGSAFGKHKFSPTISPKKSWEGVICGMIGSMLFWLLIPLTVADCGFGYAWAAVSGLLCGFIGIMGDLLESRMKRNTGVKDSGNLMPGHGGLLDRSDSLLTVSVLAGVLIWLAPVISNLTGVVL